ncbi:MAG: CPBP family intramembrane metalloprotease, partial [Romboutsia sp.]|nr:CPBP family intramembrane metalloprotease [Romboutsia sp.]
FISYSVEVFILKVNNQKVWLEFFANGFSLTGSTIKNTSLLFITLTIIFNLINSLMEEGIFRGLFLYLYSKKYSFTISNLVQSTFFGFWHIVMTVRSYLAGEMSLSGALFMGIGYIMLSFVVGIKLGLLVKYTGSLWAGFFFHTFNNSIVNLLHVITSSQIDSLQVVRVMFAQFLSLFIVWLYGFYKKRTILQKPMVHSL